MEEVLLIPPDPENEKTFCFCDNCNDKGDPENTVPVPDAWIEALGCEKGAVMLRGIFEGPLEKAIEVGWQEREWGFICPVCIAEEPHFAEYEHGEINIDGPDPEEIAKEVDAFLNNRK